MTSSCSWLTFSTWAASGFSVQVSVDLRDVHQDLGFHLPRDTGISDRRNGWNANVNKQKTQHKPTKTPNQTKKASYVRWGEVLHHECLYCSPPFMSVRASAPVKFSIASEVSVTSVPHSVPCSGTASLGFLSISRTRAWLKLYPVCSLSLHGGFFWII